MSATGSPACSTVTEINSGCTTYDIVSGSIGIVQTVNSQQSTVNSQQSTSPDGVTGIDMI